MNENTFTLNPNGSLIPTNLHVDYKQAKILVSIILLSLLTRAAGRWELGTGVGSGSYGGGARAALNDKETL